jgi:hypothetical protein
VSCLWCSEQRGHNGHASIHEGVRRMRFSSLLDRRRRCAGTRTGCAARQCQGPSQARIHVRARPRRSLRSQSLAPIRRNHHLGKPGRSAPQIAPPPINLPGNHIPQPRHLANRSARRKGLRNDRSLLHRAPAPASFRTRQHFNPAHRTVSCTGASDSACTADKTDRISLRSQGGRYRMVTSSRRPTHSNPGLHLAPGPESTRLSGRLRR